MIVSDIAKKIPVVKSDIVKDTEINGAFLDSRLVHNGSLFFASCGENNDGNLYAQKAIDAGAAAVIMDNESIYNEVAGNKILVKNTLEYMRQLGKKRFDELHNSNNRVIAVTGSFGKTGMKEMIKSIFSRQEKVYATNGNKNNMLGVMLTGCGIDDNADTVIIELGSSNEGEIKELAEIVRPDTAIVTSVGHAHIGRFKTLDKLIKEKLSISYGLASGGDLIIPAKLMQFAPKGNFKCRTFGADEHSDIKITEYKHHGECVTFKTNLTKREFRINHPYIHIAENSLCAVYAALLAGISEENIAEGLSLYKAVKGHGSFENTGEIFLIDDSYNAGFESFIKSTESLHLMNKTPKYAVYGELGEIDGYEDEFYHKIAELANIYPDIVFFLTGESYKGVKDLDNRKIFLSKDECIRLVKEIKNGVIIVKASRIKKFEDIVNAVKEK